MKYNLAIVFCAVILIASSCKKTETTVVPPPVNPKGIFVLCEGNFTGGNAAITFYDAVKRETTDDIFKSANDFQLGDVGQTITLIDGKFYVVVNNSGKIEVVNPADFKVVQTITGFTSPRSILKVSDTKAYVSDLYANHLSIVNLSSGTITGTISIKSWTEEMVMLNGNVYVGTVENTKIYVVNPATDALTDSIAVGNSPGNLLLDKNATLWALCGGSEINANNGSIYKISQPGNNVSLFHNFPSPLPYGTKLSSNSTLDTIYALASDIYRFPFQAASLPAPIIARGQHNWTALGYDSSTGNIVAGEAFDFNQNGKVYLFNQSLTKVDSFSCGILPSEILFY